MYERIKGEKKRERETGEGAPNDGDSGVQSFKSRFFWLHRHSQNPPIYRSMLNKATSTESTMLRVTIRAYIGTAINFSFFTHTTHALFLPVCFYSVRVRSLPQGESQDYEAVRNEISRLRICITRGKNTEEKSDRLRERLSHFA